MTDSTRRKVLAGMVGLLGGSTIARGVHAAVETPSATEGPYYPTGDMRRADVDNDLVKIAGKVAEAGGEVFRLFGRITDADGAPRAGHRIEIWQCDLNGNYMHPRDSRSVNFDPAFQGFGHDVTDANGDYVFRTIKPTVYPGRTPHIHVKVFEGETELLTSQFYIDGHPGNAGDRIFGRMSAAEAEAVSMVFEEGPEGLEARVDVVI